MACDIQEGRLDDPMVLSGLKFFENYENRRRSFPGSAVRKPGLLLKDGTGSGTKKELTMDYFRTKKELIHEDRQGQRKLPKGSKGDDNTTLVATSFCTCACITRPVMQVNNTCRAVACSLAYSHLFQRHSTSAHGQGKQLASPRHAALCVWVCIIKSIQNISLCVKRTAII